MRRKLIIGIIMLITTVSAITATIAIKNKDKAPGEGTDTTDLTTTIKDLPKSGNPDSYTNLDNLAILAGTITNGRNFIAETTGLVKAKVAFINYDQSVYNKRVVSKTDCLTEAVSTSSLKKVAEQKFFAKDKVFIRQPKKIAGNETSWATTTPSILTYDDIIARNGWLPTSITSYILCEQTINSTTITKNDDGTYTLVCSLNPDLASVYYKREVKTYAGATEYPIFSEITLSFNFTNSWQLLSIDSNETYDISIPVIGSLTCRSTLKEEFTYDEVEIAEKEFYSQFADLDASGDIETPMGATDYLLAAFGPYISGTVGNFKLNARINDDVISGDVALDLANLDFSKIDIKLLVGNAFINYKDEKLYIAYKDFKGYVKQNDLFALIGKLSPSGGEASLDTESLANALEEAVITKNGNQVSMTANFVLGSLALPITFNFTLEGETVKLESIKVDLVLADNNISLQLLPTTKAASYPQITNDYVNIGESEVLTTILDLALSNQFSLDFATSIVVKCQSISLSGNLILDITAGVKIKASIAIAINDFNIELELYLMDNVAYFKYGNIFVKANLDEALALLPKTNIEIKEILHTILSINYDELIKQLILTNNSVHVSLDLTKITDNDFILSLFKTLTVDIQAVDKGLNINLAELDFNASLKGHATLQDISLPKGEYYNLVDILAYKEEIKALIQTTSYNINLETTLMINETTLSISGDIYFNRSNLSAKGRLVVNVLGQNIILDIILVDNVMYVSYGNLIVGISLEELMSFIPATSTEKINIEDILAGISSVEGKLCVNINVLGQTISLILGEIEKGLSLSVSDIAIGTIKLTKTTLSIKACDEFEVSAVEANITKIDVDNIMGMVNELVKFINNESFKLNIGMNISGMDIEAQITINRDLSISALLSFTIDNKVYEINVSYVNSTLYVSYGNLKVKLQTTKLSELVEAVNYLLGQEISLEIDLDLSKLRLEEIISGITTTKNNVSIKLDLAQFNLGELVIDLSKDEKGFSLIVSDIKLGNISINEMTADVSAQQYQPVEVIDSEYYNLIDLLAYKEEIKALIQTTNYNINLETTLMINEMKLSISGDIYFNRSNLTAKGRLVVNVLGQNIILDIILVDNVMYVRALGLNISFDLATLNQIKGGNQKVDIDSIISMISSIKTIDGELNLELNMANAILSLILKQAPNGLSITIDDLEVVDVRLKNTCLTISATDFLDVRVPSGEFVNVRVEDIQSIIANINNIANNINEAKYLTFDIGIEVMGIDISGQIIINKNLNEIYINLLVTYGVYTHKIDIIYVENSIYLTFNELRLSLDNATMDVIAKAIKDVLAANGTGLSIKQQNGLTDIINKLTYSFTNLDVNNGLSIGLVIGITDILQANIKVSLTDQLVLSGLLNISGIAININQVTLGYRSDYSQTLNTNDYLPIANIASLFENLETGLSSSGTLSVRTAGYNLLLPYEMQFKFHLMNFIKGDELFKTLNLSLALTSESYDDIILTIQNGWLFLDSLNTKYKMQLPHLTINSMLGDSTGNKEAKSNDTIGMIFGYLEQISVQNNYDKNGNSGLANVLNISLAQPLLDTLNELVAKIFANDTMIKFTDFSFEAALNSDSSDFTIKIEANIMDSVSAQVNLTASTKASAFNSKIEESEFIETVDFLEHPFASRVVHILKMVSGLLDFDYATTGYQFDISFPLYSDNGLIKSIAVSGNAKLKIDNILAAQGKLIEAIKFSADINIKAKTTLFVSVNINIQAFYVGDGYLYLIVNGDAAGISFSIAEQIFDINELISSMFTAQDTSSDKAAYKDLYLNDFINEIINGFTTQDSGSIMTLKLNPAAARVINGLWRTLVELVDAQVAVINNSTLTSLISSIYNFNMDVNGFKLEYGYNEFGKMNHLVVNLSGYKHNTSIRTSLPITLTAKGECAANAFDSYINKAKEYDSVKAELRVVNQAVKDLGSFRYDAVFYEEAKKIQAIVANMSAIAAASYTNTRVSGYISLYESLTLGIETMQEILRASDLSTMSDKIFFTYNTYLYFKANPEEYLAVNSTFAVDDLVRYFAIYTTTINNELQDFINRLDTFEELTEFDMVNNSNQIGDYKKDLNELYNEYLALSAQKRAAIEVSYSAQYNKLMQMINNYNDFSLRYVNSKIEEFVSTPNVTIETVENLYNTYDFSSLYALVLDSYQASIHKKNVDAFVLSFVEQQRSEINKYIARAGMAEDILVLETLIEEYNHLTPFFKSFIPNGELLTKTLADAKANFCVDATGLLDDFVITISNRRDGKFSFNYADYCFYNEIKVESTLVSSANKLINFNNLYSSRIDIIALITGNGNQKKLDIVIDVYTFVKMVNENQSKEALTAYYDNILESKTFEYYSWSYFVSGYYLTGTSKRKYSTFFTTDSTDYAKEVYNAYLNR